MKITFVVPALNLSGGLRVVSIYAELLAKRGHKITIVSPAAKKSTIKQKLKSAIHWKGYTFNTSFDKTFFNSRNYELKVIESRRPVIEQDLPDADFVIATWWETAEWINHLTHKKGRKIYFIQHNETHDGQDIERVRETYKLPFHKITIATWLANLMKKEYGDENSYLVPNSVDMSIFYADHRAKHTVPTIGFLFSEIEFKGVRIALDVIEKLKLKIPNLKIVAFGANKPMKLSVPEYIELSINPAQSAIRNIYQQCDLWLCCSLIEGFGLTILEAMACRVPAISTRCGGPEDIITENVNGLLCDINDVTALTDASYKILNLSNREWQIFSDNAYKHALGYTWEDAAGLFEKSLQSVLSDNI